MARIGRLPGVIQTIGDGKFVVTCLLDKWLVAFGQLRAKPAAADHWLGRRAWFARLDASWFGAANHQGIGLA
jgi:hypothetical protein